MNSFWVLILIAAVLLILLMVFWDRILLMAYKKVTVPAKVIHKWEYTEMLANRRITRRDIEFELKDRTIVRLAVSRKIFNECPYLADGELTYRKDFFICFESMDGIDKKIYGKKKTVRY